MVHAAHVSDGTGGNISDENVPLVMELPLNRVWVDDGVEVGNGPGGLLGMK